MYHCSDRSLQFGSLVQSLAVRYAGKPLIGLEDIFGHPRVHVFAGLNRHSEAAKHDGY